MPRVRAGNKKLADEATFQYGPLDEALGVGIRLLFSGSDEHPTPGLVFRLLSGSTPNQVI
jgi:hypothetical protein